MRSVLPLLAIALTASLALQADAAPGRAVIRPGAVKNAAKLFEGKPTRRRGNVDTGVAKLPTRDERQQAIASVVDAPVLAEVAWASVSVRKPHKHDRAALTFLRPDAVDARRGIASFALDQAIGPLPAGIDDFLCQLFGCPGTEAAGSTPGRAMQIWVHADGSKRYAVVCRARLEDKVGDVIVASDGGFTTTNHVDHTGKSSAQVSFLVDPTATGWYGFSVSSPEAWSTSGCTVDELE